MFDVAVFGHSGSWIFLITLFMVSFKCNICSSDLIVHTGLIFEELVGL